MRSPKTLCKRIGQLAFSNARQRSRVDVLIARLEKHERGAFGRLGLHIPLEDVSPLEDELVSKPETSDELVRHSFMHNKLRRIVSQVLVATTLSTI